MLSGKGVLVGAGAIPWDNNATGETVVRNKIAVSSGVVTAIPDIYEAEPEAVKQAQALPFASNVFLEFTTNRYKNLIVRAVRAAN